MKRILILMCIAALLLAGWVLPAGGFADGAHPITFTVVCDPVPELEGDGTIESLLFTIRNESQTDYTLYNAKLLGGFEDREMILTEEIVVMAGATKEFSLTDVPVREDQLDRDIVYTLTWEEHETQIDEETGEATFLTYTRDASAAVHLEKFIIPVLTVEAVCEDVSVRIGETFTVEYTVRNDTEFDISGLKLYDPEQGMQTIPLPASELFAGQSISTKVTYTMGATDMSFAPYIEYIGRRREMTVSAVQPVKVESVVVSLEMSTELRPVTAEGNTFAITIRNNGNRPITDICVYDEINTLIEGPFSLQPDDVRTVIYTVQPAVSMDRVRTVRFHITAFDYLNEPITIEDTESYPIVPYVSPEDVNISLSVVLQSPYYDENGKLCASVQFHIRNSGDVKIYNAVLSELTLFGTVTSYQELRSGDTYYTQIYQLDGVKELKFRLDAIDPAGKACNTDVIRIDLSGLKELADRKIDPVYVQTTNPYMQTLHARYRNILRIIAIIAVCVAGICGLICILLYIVERRIKAKLPAEFEEDLERTLHTTGRRTAPQLFSDMPTEQFGYVAPIKLRNYGELTEEEANNRREQYARALRENLRREKAAVRQPEKRMPVRADDGTQVLPVTRPKPAEQPQEKSVQKPDPTPDEPIKIYRKPVRTEPPAEPTAKAVEKPEPVFRKPAEPAAKAVEKPEPVFRKPVEPAAKAVEKPEPVLRKPVEKPASEIIQPAEPVFAPAPNTVVFPTVKHTTPAVEKPAWITQEPLPQKQEEPKETVPAPIRSQKGPRKFEQKPVPARRPKERLIIRRMDGNA